MSFPSFPATAAHRYRQGVDEPDRPRLPADGHPPLAAKVLDLERAEFAQPRRGDRIVAPPRHAMAFFQHVDHGCIAAMAPAQYADIHHTSPCSMIVRLRGRRHKDASQRASRIQIRQLNESAVACPMNNRAIRADLFLREKYGHRMMNALPASRFEAHEWKSRFHAETVTV